MRVTDSAKVLRKVGLEVIEFDRPIGRGRSMAGVYAIIDHDTVTGQNWSDVSVANLLKNGRPGVPGPLSQYGMDRRGRLWFIADGKSNHNGYGTNPPGVTNNSIGLEVFCAGGLAGKEEPYNAIQRRNAAIFDAALTEFYRLPVERVLGHKESDPRRKVDPWGVNMNEIRRMVRQFRDGQVIDKPDPEEDEEMKRGHKDKEEVRYLQKYINLYFHGHSMHKAGCTVDGVFGDETHAYVREFQKRESFTTNGIVTPIQIAILQSRLIAKGRIAPASSVHAKQHASL